MSQMYERHRTVLEQAVQAISTREFWTVYPEVPSEKIYGEGARKKGQEDFQALLNQPFQLPEHPGSEMAGAEVSPHGLELGIKYPIANADELINAAVEAQRDWAKASIEERTGICLEILKRLNQNSFLMGHATMHTSGQGFPMAFQAGGPHAQDRGLEAVAYAWQAMTAVPQTAQWVKPMGRGQEVRLEKHWQIVPRGIGLVIGCRTFPTWNSYSGFFANLVTGNAVIAKPHPAAILPMALTVRIAREVLAAQGFSPNVVLLAAEKPNQNLAQALAQRSEIGIIDYTGSAEFGNWLCAHAATDLLYTEETGVNSIVISATDDFDAMCSNLAFSLALYSGQMCTTPQNLFIPKEGIRVGNEHKTYDEVVQGIVDALDALLADPERAAMIAGAIVNPDILGHIQTVQAQGKVLRPSTAYPEAGAARTASPLLVELDFDDQDIYGQEHFGPISFVIPVADVRAGIDRAAYLARHQGAITAALYELDQEHIQYGINAFTAAGVNLSINLLHGIYVNQSAAFSDFHVTGANPAGNACLTDNAFVANRFRVVMWRRPIT